jgi:hypothetical protein
MHTLMAKRKFSVAASRVELLCVGCNLVEDNRGVDLLHDGF